MRWNSVCGRRPILSCTAICAFSGHSMP